MRRACWRSSGPFTRHPLRGLPLQALDAASNWTEFRQAVSQWWGPTQNVAYADDQGHIGYQAVGLFPMRPAGLSGVPIVETGTAADSQHEWQGYLPFAQLPTVLDPENGIVATANSRITPDGFPYPLALNWDEPYRNERIWKWLSGHAKLTPADMLTLQTDTYSEVDRELAQRFAYAIDRATRLGRKAARGRGPDAHLGWSDHARIRLRPRSWMQPSKRCGRWSWSRSWAPIGSSTIWQTKNFVQEEMVEKAPPEWLPAGYKSWDDLIAAAVRKGMADDHAPLSLRDWTYGSQHVIDVRHPLYGLHAILPAMDEHRATPACGG